MLKYLNKKYYRKETIYNANTNKHSLVDPVTQLYIVDEHRRKGLGSAQK